MLDVAILYQDYKSMKKEWDIVNIIELFPRRIFEIGNNYKPDVGLMKRLLKC